MGLADIRSRIAEAKHRRLGDAVLWNGEAKTAYLAKAGDESAGFGQSFAVVESIRIDVQKSAVPNPVEGDLVTIVADGRVFKLTGTPMTSISGLEWICTAEKSDAP